MKNAKVIPWLFLFASALVLLILLAFAFKGNLLRERVVTTVQKPGTYLFDKIMTMGALFSEIRNMKDLLSENALLREENKRLLSEILSTDEIRKENEFLKEALNLPPSVKRDLIQGGVFSAAFLPEGHSLLINKGTRDGVVIDSVVISSDGVVVGVIADVFEDYSRALLITDPDVKATVSILGSDVSAIARGALGDGIFLDFISREEEVTEGDFIMTNGNDIFPTGLLLGTVDHIEVNDVDVFKKVRIKPALEDIHLGRVLIIK